MRDTTELQRAALSFQVIKLPFSWKWALCGAALMAALLIGSAIAGLPSESIFGLLSTIVMTAVLAFFLLVMLHPAGTYMLVDREQLVQCICFYRMTVRWKQVHKIRIGWLGDEAVEIAWNRQVFVDYLRNDQRLSMPIAPWTFGVTAKQLVTLLTPYYEQARNGANAPNAQFQPK